MTGTFTVAFTSIAWLTRGNEVHEIVRSAGGNGFDVVDLEDQIRGFFSAILTREGVSFEDFKTSFLRQALSPCHQGPFTSLHRSIRIGSVWDIFETPWRRPVVTCANWTARLRVGISITRYQSASSWPTTRRIHCSSIRATNSGVATSVNLANLGSVGSR